MDHIPTTTKASDVSRESHGNKFWLEIYSQLETSKLSVLQIEISKMLQNDN